MSTNAERVAEFGIDTANMFGFWDWVGGRYSMDSAIGLSTMMALGPEQFDEMLAGFHAMDEHFRTAPLAQNLPVLMGLLDRLVRRLLRRPDRRRDALRPVPQAVPRLPAAADHGVERQARHARRRVGSTTRPAPVYWGEPGTNGQHSFYQLIHQGTQLIPVDLIGFGKSLNPLGDHHDILSSNVFAQAQALAFGKTEEEVRAEGTPDGVVPHRVMRGQPADQRAARRDSSHPRRSARWSRSTSTACSRRATIWGIDSFDQWGVELGKVLAVRSSPSSRATTEPELGHDSSTNALIRRYRALKKTRRTHMATDKPMQLGMVGLGRMGANLVRRLMRDGHRCVVYDVNAAAVKELDGEGATGRDVAGGLRREAGQAAGRLAHAAGRDRRPDARPARAAAGARRHRDRRRQLLLPRRHHAGPSSWRRRASTTSTAAPAAGCGASSAATA